MNSPLPLWLAGTLLKAAVSGAGLAATASVAALVRTSSRSDVQVRGAWMSGSPFGGISPGLRDRPGHGW